MIYLYGNKQCLSSQKAIKWFNRYGVKFCEKSPGQMSRKDIINVLASTNKGIPELIRHSKIVDEEGETMMRILNKKTLNQAIDFIKVHPNYIKTPIIIEGDKALIGYNLDQIRIFLPKNYRRSIFYKDIG